MLLYYMLCYFISYMRTSYQMRTLLSLTTALTVATGGAFADVPEIVTDTPVVHSLVSMVVGDLGTPEILLDAGSDPHAFQLRPSQATSIQNADLIFWIGEELTPWLERAIDASSGDALSLALLDAPGVHLIEFGEEADDDLHSDAEHDHDHGAEDKDHAEAEHDHDAEDEDHAEADHDHDHDAEDKDHAEAEHDHDAEGEDHAEAEHDHAHDHGGLDPHAWLDPDNALVWIDVIRNTLISADPDNAATYRLNAANAQNRVAEASQAAEVTLASVHDQSIVVFHDAYDYWAEAFDVSIVGSLALGDAADPGVRHLRELQEIVSEQDISCAFSEPQHNPSLAESLANDAGIGLGVLDPSGTSLNFGADLYPQLLTQLADATAACVSAQSS